MVSSQQKPPQPKKDILDVYSFDYSAHKVPLAYKAYGQSVELLTKTKLISQVQSKSGAVFLSEILHTQQYEVDVEFTYQSASNNSTGFEILFLKSEPEFLGNAGTAIGLRENFKGIGVFLFKSRVKYPNKWYVLLLQSKNLLRYRYNDLDDWILPSNSCPFEFNQGIRSGIRIRVNKNLIEIDIMSGDVEYKSCTRFKNNEMFKPYIGVMASNIQGGANDIDIVAMYVKNMDINLYKNAQALEEYRLKMLYRKHENGLDLQGGVHSIDLLSVKLQEQIKLQQKENLVFFDLKDDQFEVMFKYYEALKDYVLNIQEMQDRLESYKENLVFGSQMTITAKQMDVVEENLKIVSLKTSSLKNEYEKVSNLVQTATQKEYLDLTQDESEKVKTKRQQEEIKLVKVSGNLQDLIQKLKKASEEIVDKVNEDQKLLKQFIEDFPEVYILENDKQKKERLQKQSRRKVPDHLIRILQSGAYEMKAQVDKDNESGFPILNFLVLVVIVAVLLLIWDKLREKMGTKGTSKSHSY